MDEFSVPIEGKDAQLFVLLAYLTAGNWDLDDIATGVEYIKELEKDSRNKGNHLEVIK